jgi:putative transposase
VNGYYKSVIYGPARSVPWKTIEDVNTNRLHGYLNDLPPAEFEAIFYATKRTDQPLIEIQ